MSFSWPQLYITTRLQTFEYNLLEQRLYLFSISILSFVTIYLYPSKSNTPYNMSNIIPCNLSKQLTKRDAKLMTLPFIENKNIRSSESSWKLDLERNSQRREKPLTRKQRVHLPMRRVLYASQRRQRPKKKKSENKTSQWQQLQRQKRKTTIKTTNKTNSTPLT